MQWNCHRDVGLRIRLYRTVLQNPKIATTHLYTLWKTHAGVMLYSCIGKIPHYQLSTCLLQVLVLPVWVTAKSVSIQNFNCPIWAWPLTLPVQGEYFHQIWSFCKPLFWTYEPEWEGQTDRRTGSLCNTDSIEGREAVTIKHHNNLTWMTAVLSNMNCSAQTYKCICIMLILRGILVFVIHQQLKQQQCSFNGQYSRTAWVCRQLPERQTIPDFDATRWWEVAVLTTCKAPIYTHSTFTGLMPFLLPNQQRQNTEGKAINIWR